MRVELKAPEDLLVLRQRVRTERDATQRDRLRVVLLAAEGRGGLELRRKQIAETTGRSRQFVDEWVGRYRRRGLDGLVSGKAKGNPPTLSPEQAERFKQRMLAGPTEADGVCTLRGRDARRILAEEFNKPLKLTAVYNLLHRLNLSCLKPRARHRKNDPQAVEAWKQSAPFFSSR